MKDFMQSDMGPKDHTFSNEDSNRVMIALAQLGLSVDELEKIAADKAEVIRDEGYLAMKFGDNIPDAFKHYYRDVRHLGSVDVYNIIQLFSLAEETDTVAHAFKKLIAGGTRGYKDTLKDHYEAAFTLCRGLELKGFLTMTKNQDGFTVRKKEDPKMENLKGSDVLAEDEVVEFVKENNLAQKFQDAQIRKEGR